jgi:plastocyanin
MGKTSIALTILALALLAAAPAQAAKVVHTRGGDEVKPNEFIGSTHRFAPGTLYVKPGQRVTWIDGDINGDRHTITAVTKAHWPRTRTAINTCPFCFLADGHFENPADPNGSNILALKLQVGPAGYQTEGDSLLLQNRHRISALIKAPVGRTVYYFCRVHPWMSGKIVVNRTGTAPKRTTTAALAGLAARPH